MANIQYGIPGRSYSLSTVILIIINRTLSVFVFVPAAILLAILFLASNFSFNEMGRTVVDSLYQMQQLGKAEPGQLLIKRCDDGRYESATELPPVRCEHWTIEPAPVANLAERLGSTIASMYWLFVVLSFGVSLLFWPASPLNLRSTAAELVSRLWRRVAGKIQRKGGGHGH